MIGRWTAAFVLIAACSACKPTICYFRAQPNVACANHVVQLSWKASTGGSIVDVVDGRLVGTTARLGALALLPTRTERYRLDVRNHFGTTSREVDVTVPGDRSEEIGASIADKSAKCEHGILSVTADAKATYWDPHLRAAGVAPVGGVPMHVEHLGVGVDVPVGGSDAFKALPIAGRWDLSIRLSPGQECGPGVPNVLAIKVSSACFQ